MNTATATSTTNSSNQDKSVNQNETQFTSDDAVAQAPATSFVSQFDTQASAKKDAKSANVKLSTTNVHVYL